MEQGNEEHHEDEHDKGYHNEDKKLDDETLKEYNIKGTDQAFREGEIHCCFIEIRHFFKKICYRHVLLEGTSLSIYFVKT